MTEGPDPDFGTQIESFCGLYARIVEQVQAVIVGHHRVIHEVLACMLSGGHALLEGVPGIGKTLLVRTLADALDLEFARIQFTPDLMPSDITGTNIVVADEAGAKSFRFQQGPVFANLVLADEINRATPKTQSAVLEAMQEQTVTVSRTTHELPQPFFVLATENPIEMEGTYPLPEAQLDRFMLKVNVASPPADELVTIMDRTTGAAEPQAAKAADGPQVLQMRKTVRQVVAASHVKQYIAAVLRATHPDSDSAPEAARRFVRYGASPRGAQAMLLTAKVLALRDGRANVAFDDVREVAPAALRHRLILSFEGQAEGVEPDRIVAEVLDQVPRPPAP
ncbi:MAG TPA: MoxR family ATPase [Phycisphaerae bacterium]|nr:MoxR family ATPase [Phycisphaerae bacterium]HUT62029.1 MoxR family ATPase [Phycisphaerae bacterium]